MYDTMTPEELAAQIAAAKSRLEAMQNAMAPKREELTAQLIEQLRSAIDASGLDAAVIAAAIAPPAKEEKKRARKPREERKPAAVYALVSDPSKIYSRGKMPAWLTEAMTGNGYDPDDRASRDKFRVDHMQRAV